MKRNSYLPTIAIILAVFLILFLNACQQMNDVPKPKFIDSGESHLSQSYSITIVPTDQKVSPELSVTQSPIPNNISPSLNIYPDPDANMMAEPIIEGTPYPAPGGFENSSLPNLETALNPIQSPESNILLDGTPTSADSTQPTIRTQLEATDPTTFRLANGQIQLVEFFAFWSPISKSIAPILYLLETRYGDRVNFVYLDIEDPANDLYTKLIGDKLPPVIYLIAADGSVIREWNGLISLEELEEGLQSVLP